MRRRRWASPVLVGLLVCTTPAVALAWSSQSGPNPTGKGPLEFVGETSQGTPIDFFVVHTHSGLGVQVADVEVGITCPGSDGEGTVGLGGGGRPHRLNGDGTFSFHLYDYWLGHFDFDGQITRSKAKGTISSDISAVTRDRGTQLCLSGPISWSATENGSSVTYRQTVPHLQITESDSGRLNWTMTAR